MIRLLSVPLVVLLLAGGAGASGSLEAGPVNVSFENGHRTDCVDPQTGLCLASASGDSVGNTAVDARQFVDYVELRANGSFLRDMHPALLLPDATLLLDLREVRVEHPVFILLTQHVGERRGPGPLSDFGLLFNESGFDVYFLGPNFAEPTEGIGPTWRGFAYSRQGGTAYDHFGPFHGVEADSTDGMAEDVAWAGCKFADPGCPAYETAVEAAAPLTPNVRLGVALYEARAAVGEEPAMVSAAGERATAAALGPRGGALPVVPSRMLEPAGVGATLGAGPAAPAPDLSAPRSAPAGARVPTRTLAQEVEQAPPPSPLLPLATAFALAVLLAALYSRLRGSELTRTNAWRARIVDALTAQGPQGITDLARLLGLDRTTVLYHARLLERAGHLRMAPHGRATFVLLPGQQLPQVRPPAEAEMEQHLLEAIASAGGTLPRRDLREVVAPEKMRLRNKVIQALVQSGRLTRGFVGNEEVVRMAEQA